mgnify:CR=1 FL=1
MIGTAGGLLIAGATVATVFVGVFLLVKVSEFVLGVRAELRDYFGRPHWKPAGQDFALIPLWVLAELFCFFGALLAGLLHLVIAYQGARAVRDWWHAGARKR